VALDPYRYFRIEARELVEGLGRGLLELEKANAGAETSKSIDRLLRLAHTLKGAARVVKQAKIAELAHAIEDLLEPHRDAPDAPSERAEVTHLLQLVDAIAALVTMLDAPAPPANVANVANVAAAASPPHGHGQSGHNGGPDGANGGRNDAPKGPARALAAPAVARAAEPLENVRVDVGEMDALVEGLTEVSVRLTAMRAPVHELRRARALTAALATQLARGNEERDDVTTRRTAQELQLLLGQVERALGDGLDETGRELVDVGEQANRLRLMPVSSMFSALERAARDAAEALDKEVRFETAGGDQRIDANVLAPLREALLHVVRNAVTHGLETKAERLAAGKPPVGRVWLEVERRQSRIAFVCRDDGRGIDAPAVRRAAVARGLIGEAEAVQLSTEQIVRLVLISGVTTATALTDLAGRGVGLDVLRAAVAQLKGDVTIATEPGRGTTIDVCVPISMASLAALVVEAGGVTVALPLDGVQQALRVVAADIAGAATHDSLVVDGQPLPFLRLATLLPGATVGPPPAACPAIVVRVGKDQDRAVLGIDRLVGTADLVMRPLPRLAGASELVAGASLDADGHPQLVLDAAALVRAAQAGRGPVVVVPAVVRAPVLIIDDSLTTRMLEQSILESAGYTVELATSAEEGLELARARPFCLFVVDVEMPGMSGLTFVERTRRDPQLQQVPAILVTSRGSADDRRRGAEAGANDYIVKGEFDQGRLLDTIRRLVG
jgi:two-component system chemotaxis sensor kinase CheA